MALSGETNEGLDFIWESRILYADILYNFRECHDVCLHSELFTKGIILKIDQCAVDFRQLSFDTVTIAKSVSNQWLDVAITFFECIDDADDPKEMLKLLGDQAREIAQCFKLIAAWAGNIAGRFHEAQDGIIKEAKQAYEAAQKEAEYIQQVAKEEYARAERLRNAEHSEGEWKTAQAFLSWIPLVSQVSQMVTAPGVALAKERVAKASELEAEARDKLRKTEQELQQKRSQNKKAQLVAEKAGTLVKILVKLEETWTVEADTFNSQGAKMKTNHVAMFKGMKGVVVKNNIAFWKKAKDKMDYYITAMSVINNCFNFTTDAKPPAAQTIKFASLKLEFHIPADINVN